MTAHKTVGVGAVDPSPAPQGTFSPTRSSPAPTNLEQGPGSAAARGSVDASLAPVSDPIVTRRFFGPRGHVTVHECARCSAIVRTDLERCPACHAPFGG